MYVFENQYSGVPETATFLDENGELISYMSGGNEGERRYGAPTYHIHVSSIL